MLKSKALERLILLKYRSFLTSGETIDLPLVDVASFETGYSYSSDELQPSQIGMVTIKSFDRNGGFKPDGIKPIVPAKKAWKTKTVEPDDILVAHTDLTQEKEVVGNTVIVNGLHGFEELVMSMDLVRVRTTSKTIGQSLLYACLSDSFKEWALGHCSGTTVVHLSKKALERFVIRVPREDADQVHLSEAISVLLQEQRNLIQKSRELKEQRSLLLKKYFG